MDLEQSQTSRRAGHVVMALVAGTAVALFLAESAPRPPARAQAVPVRARGAHPAPTYSQLRDQRRGPNGAMYEGAFATLEFAAEPTGPDELTPEAREHALAQRRQRRAYAGAPPVIPHAVSQREPVDCLACHARGARIAGKIAHPMSHIEYASCTQCHVVANAPIPLTASLADNSFAGLESFGKGQRVQPGAPPTIPHPTRMRSQCGSCHGPHGLFGLRTPHPERQSCEQCHAPSANLNQSATAGLGSIGFARGAQP